MGDLTTSIERLRVFDPKVLEDVISCKVKWIEEAKKTVKVANEEDLKIDRFNSSSIIKMTLATWLGGARDIMTRQAEMILKLQQIIEQQKTEALADKENVIELQSELIQSKNYQLLSLQSAVQNTVQTTVQKEVRQYSEVVSKNISNTAPVVSTDSLKKAVKSALSDEDRSRNVMVFGLCEDAGEQLDTKIGELFQELSEKPQYTASRVGKFPGSTEKSRPVKVVLSSSGITKQILTKSGKLKQTQQFKKVYLRPDMTPEEREVRNKLVSDLKKAISNQPHRYHFIQGGEIISKEKVGT